MRRNLLYGLIGGGLVVAAVAALPLLVPTTSLRGAIETQVSRATGRAFKINGALSVSIFPGLGLDARDVALANAPGWVARDLVHIERMRIAVKLWPLLSGKIEVSQIVLEKPVIALEVTYRGEANWLMTPQRGAAGGPALPPNAEFAGVRIEGGRVSYDDDEVDTHGAIADLDADVALVSLALPTGVSGAFTLRGRRLKFATTIATPQMLLAGKPMEVNLALTSDFLNAAFLGRVTREGNASGTGTLRAPSLKDLAAWLGRPVSAGRGLGALSAQADIAMMGQSIQLRELKAKLDAMTMQGELFVDYRLPMPFVEGAMSIDALDLNTYLQLGGGGPQHAPSGPPGGGWSRTPVKLDLLKLANGEVTLSVGTLRVLHLKTGKAVIALALRDGLMTAHLGPMQLYGGSGTADLTVDTRGPSPSVANKLSFASIAMGPFLADTIGVDKLAGTGTIALDVTSSGASPDAIMRALSGKGVVAIGRGSVHGVDMGQVARTVQTILSAGATGQSATTPFDSFRGSFSISNGMLWNGDLKLDSAFLRMTGQGHLDLGNQTIAYRIEPKASIGGRMHLLDVGVPFAISGPWSHVHYVPDLAGAVTGLVGSVIDKGAAPLTGLFSGLTGKPAPKKKSKGPGDTLKSIFGLH